MFLYRLKTTTADVSDGAVQGVCLRPLTCSDCGFNTGLGHGYLSLRAYYVLSDTDLCVGPITRTEES